MIYLQHPNRILAQMSSPIQAIYDVQVNVSVQGIKWFTFQA